MGYKLQNEEGKVYGNIWREDMEGKIMQLCYNPKNKS